MVTLAVLHKSGAKHAHKLHGFDVNNPESQAIAISGDGRYVVCGQAYTFAVYAKNGANFSCACLLGWFCFLSSVLFFSIRLAAL